MSEPDPVRAESNGAGLSRVLVSSREIFRGQREVVILHGGHEYRLRITRADKLSTDIETRRNLNGSTCRACLS